MNKTRQDAYDRVLLSSMGWRAESPSLVYLEAFRFFLYQLLARVDKAIAEKYADVEAAENAAELNTLEVS